MDPGGLFGAVFPSCDAEGIRLGSDEPDVDPIRFPLVKFHANCDKPLDMPDKIGVLVYPYGYREGEDAELLIFDSASLAVHLIPPWGRGQCQQMHEAAFFAAYNRMPEGQVDVCCGFGWKDKVLKFNSFTFNCNGARNLSTAFHNRDKEASEMEKKVIRRCWEVYKDGPVFNADSYAAEHQGIRFDEESVSHLAEVCQCSPAQARHVFRSVGCCDVELALEWLHERREAQWLAYPDVHFTIRPEDGFPAFPQGFNATFIPDPDDNDAVVRYVDNKGGAPFPLLHEARQQFCLWPQGQASDDNWYFDQSFDDNWYFDFGHNTIAYDGGGVDDAGNWVRNTTKVLLGEGQWKKKARGNVADGPLAERNEVPQGQGQWQFWRESSREWQNMEFAPEVYEVLEKDFCQGACQLRYTFSYHRTGRRATTLADDTGHAYYIDFVQAIECGADPPAAGPYMRQVDLWYPKDIPGHRQRGKAVRRIHKPLARTESAGMAADWNDSHRDEIEYCGYPAVDRNKARDALDENNNDRAAAVAYLDDCMRQELQYVYEARLAERFPDAPLELIQRALQQCNWHVDQAEALLFATFG